ncbi:MAG: aminotransferase class V-fold PLP-dependent enzyme [Deltaproteobacteria bacterium]|nr:aminotransferase class V-fold PLP-dependent enzyme [Deltaproteobacteria bacterium]
MDSLISQRQLFDIPDEVAYFNCAYYSPQLNASRNRLHNGVNTKNHPWERTPDSFFDDAETIRSLSSAIFGGDSDGFAVIPAASYGISTAARAIEPRLQSGDQILVIAEEFPSNILPWKRTAQETCAEISTVPEPKDGNWTQGILDRIVSGVKVVAVSTCHWTNGSYIDLLPIGKACRDINAILVVDGTQTLAAMPFSIENIQPDFLVAAGYKWLLCPYGFSLLYVSEQWRNARPLEETWLARDNAENFAELVKYSDAYMPGARRFDVGEKCTPTILPGVIAALEQIKAWGVKRISKSLAIVNKQIGLHLEQLGFHLPSESQRCPHMLGALFPERFRGNLVSELAKRNVYISQRGNALRFAPHLHVNNHDINRLLKALEDLMR